MTNRHFFCCFSSSQAPKIPERYSAELRTICDKMLCKDPAMRPTAKEILESPCLKVSNLNSHSPAAVAAAAVLATGVVLLPPGLLPCFCYCLH